MDCHAVISKEDEWDIQTLSTRSHDLQRLYNQTPVCSPRLKKHN